MTTTLDFVNNNWTMTTIPHDEEHHQMMTYNITSWHTTSRDDIQHCVVIYNIKKWPNIAWWYATAHDDTQHSMMIYNTEWWNATAFDNIHVQHHIMTHNISCLYTTSHDDIQHNTEKCYQSTSVIPHWISDHIQCHTYTRVVSWHRIYHILNIC